MEAQQHAHWIAQAGAHWKQHQPKRYKALLQSGQLAPALKAAAEATSRDMEELRPQVGQESAGEMVRERHLFPPEEKGNSPEAPRSAGYRAMREVNRDLGSIRMPGERKPPPG